MNFGKIQFEVDILLSKLSVEWMVMVRVLHGVLGVWRCLGDWEW